MKRDMKPFNFAEAKIVERNYRRRYVNAKLRRIAVLAAVTVAVTAVSLMLKSAYAKPLHHARSELSRIESRCEYAKQEIAVVNKDTVERKWQADLSKSSRRVIGMLNSILASVPEDVWLSRVETVGGDQEIRVDGCAASFASMSDMTGSLRAVPAFTAVRISSTRTIGPNGTEPVEFSLQIRIKGSDTAGPEGRSASAAAAVPQVGGSY
jgi:Tfp pilus assembly protein PilN